MFETVKQSIDLNKIFTEQILIIKIKITYY